jgi:hypothetical protein
VATVFWSSAAIAFRFASAQPPQAIIVRFRALGEVPRPNRLLDVGHAARMKAANKTPEMEADER